MKRIITAALIAIVSVVALGGLFLLNETAAGRTFAQNISEQGLPALYIPAFTGAGIRADAIVWEQTAESVTTKYTVAPAALADDPADDRWLKTTGTDTEWAALPAYPQPFSTIPNNVIGGVGASAGTSDAYSRGDHKHQLQTPHANELAPDPSAGKFLKATSTSGVEWAETHTGIREGSITTAMLSDGAVIGRKIAGNAVASGHLVNSAIINTTRLENNSVTGEKIPANQINNGHMLDNAVNTAEIAADAVTEAKLSSGVRTKLNATGGTGIDQTARTAATTAQTRADAAYTLADGKQDPLTHAELIRSLHFSITPQIVRGYGTPKAQNSNDVPLDWYIAVKNGVQMPDTWMQLSLNGNPTLAAPPPSTPGADLHRHELTATDTYQYTLSTANRGTMIDARTAQRQGLDIQAVLFFYDAITGGNEIDRMVLTVDWVEKTATSLTDAQIGDKAFSNPPSDLTNDEKTAVRTAIGAGGVTPTATTTRQGTVELATGGEMNAGTANLVPDAAAVKFYTDTLVGAQTTASVLLTRLIGGITPNQLNADAATEKRAFRALLGSSSISTGNTLPAVTQHNVGDTRIITQTVASGLSYVDITAPSTTLTSADAGDVMVILTGRTTVWTRVGNILGTRIPRRFEHNVCGPSLTGQRPASPGNCSTGQATATLPAGTHSIIITATLTKSGVSKRYQKPILISALTAGAVAWMIDSGNPSSYTGNRDFDISLAYNSTSRVLTYNINTGLAQTAETINSITAVGEQ